MLRLGDDDGHEDCCCVSCPDARKNSWELSLEVGRDIMFRSLKMCKFLNSKIFLL